MNECIFSSMHKTVGGALPDKLDRPPALLNPLVLAYIGDTVYDLYVRTYLIHKTDFKAHGLHVRAASHVCAAAQAGALSRIKDMLTDEELAICRRGRNAHVNTVPKNANPADYRDATGLETLVGYLYLSGRDERLNGLMSIILKG